MIYAFNGNVIRLTKRGFNQWKKAYKNIPDLMAELQKADDYYTIHRPEDGTWYIRVSYWLAKANKEYNPGSKQSTREKFSNALQSIGGPISGQNTTLRLYKR